MGSTYVTQGAVAAATPFDNSTNGFVADNVQTAIEEVRSLFSTPSTDQSYYVSKQGNDTTGNGSIGAPYLTIGKALTTITDSSPTKRYVILVGPGDYNENLALKANVFVKGSGPIVTRLTGTTLNINDTTWNVGSADNRSGFQDMSVNPVCTWDFTAQAGNTDGKLYFFNIRTSGAWTATAQNAINQLIMHDSQIFGNTTFNGMNTYLTGCVWQAGAIAVNSSATAGVPAILTIVGGRTNGAITATWTSNSAVTLNLAAIAVGASTVLTASGASCTVNVNDASLPVPANRSFVSSAILNRLNDNFARGLLSATTNIDFSASTAPSAGMVPVASNSTTAAWDYLTSTTVDFGDGSDGSPTINTPIVLSKTMYYNDLTITTGGSINANGYKIYVKGTLTNSVTGGIFRTPNNGTNGSGATNGNGGAALTENDVGPGLAGQAGVASSAGGLGGNTGNAGNNAGTAEGYGNAGGASGAAGSGGTGGTAGTYTHVPERVIRHDHIYKLDYKNGGQGGAGGAGGASAAFGQGGGGGGGGSGGGVLVIFARVLNNTGSFTCLGGNGGNGGAATAGNSRGGGGGGGGGGGQIYIITVSTTSIGTLNVAGGSAGSGGAGNGSGAAGAAGSVGSTGHTTVFASSTNTWTVT